MSSKDFRVYNIADYIIAGHQSYQRVSMVFHETIFAPDGRTFHRWTHTPTAIRSLTHTEPSHRVKLYAEECMKTFREIPEFTVFSASEYAKILGVSHVTAKKRLLKECETNNYLIQISPKHFVRCNDLRALLFVNEVMHLFNKHAKPDKRYPNIRVVAGSYTISNVLKKLKELREFAHENRYAFYSDITKVVPVKLLSWLQSVGIIRKINLDFMFTRKSILYFSFLI